MKESTKDKLKGGAKQVIGRIRENKGKASNEPNVESTGRSEKTAGTVRKKVGDVKKVFGA